MPEKVQLGLLGNGIGRSSAGRLHEMLGGLYGIDVSYRLMDLSHRPQPVSLYDELQRCRKEGFRGVNVTHPYKRDVLPHVQTLAHFPDGLTAINTVVFRDPEMIGDNTDYSGFCRAFRRRFGESCKPGKVLMLGAGGVGVAIAFALVTLGVEELVVLDKKPSEAEKLVQLIALQGAKARVATRSLIADMRIVDGLVNATPMGMFQYPGNPFPVPGVGPQRWAFDAVYTPENTAFIQACRDRGIETLSGFDLFLFQGMDAFQRFTGIKVDSDRAGKEFQRRHNLCRVT